MKTTAHTAPYGSWRSPITAQQIAAGSKRLGEVRIAGERVVWVEMRPSEGGRYVLLEATADGLGRELLPPNFSARTRVHEYGGGVLAVGPRRIFAVSDTDQQLHELAIDGTLRQLTDAPGKRFADLEWSPGTQALVAVCEGEQHGFRRAENICRALEGELCFFSRAFDFAPADAIDPVRIENV
ncbi:MAG: hypothetical protein HQ582_16880 [Planctomycetes bacterium]|nr:hypothetical protein [Planctomycetota bacterium]